MTISPNGISADMKELNIAAIIRYLDEQEERIASLEELTAGLVKGLEETVVCLREIKEWIKNHG